MVGLLLLLAPLVDCTGPQPSDGYGVTGYSASSRAVSVRLLEDPGAGRVGGCNTEAPRPVIHHLSLPGLRPLPAAAAFEAPAELPDLVVHRCLTRQTLRPYYSLVHLGGPLAGYAIEVSPSRNIMTLRLIDKRVEPAKVEVLGKVGVRTLEWCDRTDVAEGHCPNPAQGEIRQVVLAGDHLVLTMALGFADVCGQDDLMVKAFALPAAVRRALRP